MASDVEIRINVRGKMLLCVLTFLDTCSQVQHAEKTVLPKGSVGAVVL